MYTNIHGTKIPSVRCRARDSKTVTGVGIVMKSLGWRGRVARRCFPRATLSEPQRRRDSVPERSPLPALEPRYFNIWRSAALPRTRRSPKSDLRRCVVSALSTRRIPINYLQYFEQSARSSLRRIAQFNANECEVDRVNNSRYSIS